MFIPHEYTQIHDFTNYSGSSCMYTYICLFQLVYNFELNMLIAVLYTYMTTIIIPGITGLHDPI